MKKYAYTFMLLATLIVASPYMVRKAVPGLIPVSTVQTEETTEETPFFTEEESMEMEGTETEEIIETLQCETDTVSENEPEPPWVPALSYFDDALFIGDSRTIGLYEYSNLGNADVYANTGMSIYKLYKLKNAITFPEKGTRQMLLEILEEKKYGKIYIMLGINELGYDFNTTMAKYREEVLKIKEMQPDAVFYLQANLHVTNSKVAKDSVFNNQKINRVNEAVSELAQELGMIYIDVNPIFDDEAGALRADYTYDGVHLLAKYYPQWADWILQQAVRP